MCRYTETTHTWDLKNTLLFTQSHLQLTMKYWSFPQVSHYILVAKIIIILRNTLNISFIIFERKLVVLIEKKTNQWWPSPKDSVVILLMINGQNSRFFFQLIEKTISIDCLFSYQLPSPLFQMWRLTQFQRQVLFRPQGVELQTQTQPGMQGTNQQ